MSLRLLSKQAYNRFLCNARCIRTSVNATSQDGIPTKAVLYISGLGMVCTGLYYLVANGPTRSAPTLSTASLSPSHFTPVIVTTSTACTPYTKMLTFQIPPHLVPIDNENLTPIYSIYVKDSDIQIERPYTPLEGIDTQGQMSFWVKRYQGGEVGRWLHERKVGEKIEIRGPVPNWTWQDGAWDEIIMISGGTGITPFYQLLHGVFGEVKEDRLPQTRFTLLHSSPRPSDLPPPKILDSLQDWATRWPDSFKLRLYVDSMKPKVDHVDMGKLNGGRIGRRAVREALLRTKEWWWNRLWTRGGADIELHRRKTLFLVCGPEPMVVALAGPRGRKLSQGKVGGVLGSLGASQEQVYKL